MKCLESTTNEFEKKTLLRYESLEISYQRRCAAKLNFPRKGTEICTMSDIGGCIEKFKTSTIDIKILTAFGDEGRR